MKIISENSQISTSANAVSNTLSKQTLNSMSVLDSTSLSDFLTLNEQQLSYHEMEEIPVRGVDLVEQFCANVEHLADLSNRLRFMNKELRYLLKA